MAKKKINEPEMKVSLKRISTMTGILVLASILIGFFLTIIFV